jgi:hypothetical protein
VANSPLKMATIRKGGQVARNLDTFGKTNKTKRKTPEIPCNPAKAIRVAAESDALAAKSGVAGSGGNSWRLAD